MKFVAYLSLGSTICRAASAAAAAVAEADATPTRSEPAIVEERQLLSGIVGTLGGVLGDLDNALKSGDRDGVLGALRKLSPQKTPKSIQEATSILQTVATSRPKNLLDYNAKLIAGGILSGSVSDLFNYAEGLVSAENSNANRNPPPKKSVYPSAGPCDARYSVSEEDLRSAIYIPPTFTYGDKLPVILFPGTGSTGYITFKGNFIPLLTNVGWADPVWVNVPNFLLDDAQKNAEYAAYAMNYIASLTARKVAIIAWSQGNINTQWAFKYWPSTRLVTTDHVAISADYKGTVLANFADITGVTNTPAVVQQEAGSNFVATLRSNGGDSGFVPTTSIYSAFLDEIVQPQAGAAASALLLDNNRVGVTNYEVQTACAGQLGGSFYTHEGMLANPLAFALAKDALTQPGPGKLSRLNKREVCAPYLAPGLGLSDFLLTENAILIAGITVVTYLPKTLAEPPLMAYTSSSRPLFCRRAVAF